MGHTAYGAMRPARMPQANAGFSAQSGFMRLAGGIHVAA